MAHKALTSAHFTRATVDCRSEVQLLIVQRNDLLARSLARYLSAHYSEVVVVGTAQAAEAHLRNARETTFHLICGQALGLGEENGAACIARWRADFPGISRAILATGAERLDASLPGVDGVFQKPGDPSDLVALLQVLAPSATRAEPYMPPTHKDIMTSNKTKAHDLKTLKERSAVVAAAKTTTAVVPKAAQGFTIV